MKRAGREVALRRRSTTTTTIMMTIRSLAGKNVETFPDSGALCRQIVTLILFFSAVAFPCLVIYNGAYTLRFLPRPSDPAVSLFNNFFSVDTNDSSSDSEEFRLERVLKEAAMEDKTVILTTLNAAWAAPGSIIDLFLESFRIGEHTRRLLNHLVIIAFDQKAFSTCLSVHTHCFALTTEGVDFSGEAYFMTPDYLKMMWRRIDFLRSVLEMGYNFIFTLLLSLNCVRQCEFIGFLNKVFLVNFDVPDKLNAKLEDADIMWFRDPFPRFYLDADFQIACDNFFGSSYDLQNKPNGGFNYVKSNNRSIEFYKFWYSSRDTYPGYHDQDVLNMIKYDPFITDIGLKIRFLRTAYFGGICEPSRNLNLVCTMHANCCYGLNSKLHDIKVMLDVWRRFMSLPPVMKRSHLVSWRVPQNCSLASLRHNYRPKSVIEAD